MIDGSAAIDLDGFWIGDLLHVNQSSRRVGKVVLPLITLVGDNWMTLFSRVGDRLQIN